MLTALEAVIATAKPKFGSKIILGYSGGVDSEVLACLLAQYAQVHPEYHYLLVYVHHGLSANADIWAAHCQQRAQGYDLPFELAEVKVVTGPRLSLESEARKARYQAISQRMNKGDLLLTAHHLDDQLETILLALKRGQGPMGLAAMGQIQTFAQGLQVRPLLNFSRDEITDYAAKQGLIHIEDESNLDISYDRNFLRHQIIPKLKLRWPQLANTAARSAQLCAQQQIALDEVVAEKLAKMIKINWWGEGLVLTDFFQQAEHWQSLLLRAFIIRHHLPLPSQQQLMEALHQLKNAKLDANLMIQSTNLVIKRFNHCAYLMRRNDIVSNGTISLTVSTNIAFGAFTVNTKLADTGNSRLVLIEGDEDYLIGTMTDFELSGSLVCQPDFRDKSRALKKCWQELNIPPWLRTQLPCIFFKKQFVGVAGLWIEKGFLAKDGELGIKLNIGLKPDHSSNINATYRH